MPISYPVLQEIRCFRKLAGSSIKDKTLRRWNPQSLTERNKSELKAIYSRERFVRTTPIVKVAAINKSI